MRFRFDHVKIIARREFLATVRRRAYIVTLIGMPIYMAFVSFLGTLPTIMARRATEARVVAIVDQARALGLASGQDAAMDDTWKARPFADLPSAKAAFARGEVRTILVLPPGYLATGRTVEYRHAGGLLTAGRLGPPFDDFLRRRLLDGRLDSTLVARALSPVADSVLVATRTGGFEPDDKLRRVLQFALPMGFAFLLSIGIFTSGGYLMQGLGEEKESRILESLVALVTPDELMLGKMFGLGAAGLGLVVVWSALGSLLLLAHPMPVAIGAGTVLLAGYYFLVGYFFFGSFMLAAGSLVSTYQEANQWTALISLTALSPFFVLSAILDQPNGAVAVGVSLFPWTAPVGMMLRLPSGVVPGWQIALSMALLLAAALFMVRLAARIFRVGLLLYGKTPNLPEILRWSRSA